MPRAGLPLNNTQVPVSGPIGMPDLLDFTLVTQISRDYALEQMQGAVEYFQAIYINNRQNANPVVIQFSGLQYEIQCRGNRQGIWPVLCAQGALSLTASMLALGAKVPIILFNVQQPYFVWDV